MFPPVNNNQAIDYMMRRSSFNSRPLSEATEIQDLDYEVEYFEPESPRRSIESVSVHINQVSVWEPCIH